FPRDWSSDVCSSDLAFGHAAGQPAVGPHRGRTHVALQAGHGAGEGELVVDAADLDFVAQDQAAEQGHAAGAARAVEMNALVVGDAFDVLGAKHAGTVEIVGDGGVGVPGAVGLAATLPEVVNAARIKVDDRHVRVLLGVGRGVVGDGDVDAAHARVQPERVVGREAMLAGLDVALREV